MTGKLEVFGYSVEKLNYSPMPEPLLSGNPFKGETLKYGYSDFVLSGILVKFSYSGTLCAVKITLGKNFCPTRIALTDGTNILDEFSGETGKAISEKTITLKADNAEGELFLTFDSNYTDIEIESIELFGALNEETLFPTPYSVKRKGYLVDLKPVEEIFDADIEGYTVKIDENAIKITYSEKLYLNMARARIEKLTEGDKIPAIEIIDKPFCNFRGVHLYMPAVEDFDFFKKLVKEILVPLGYNYIILEICGSMEFKSHPEINECYLLAQENAEKGIWPKLPHGAVASGTVVPQSFVKELCAFCRDLGIEIIPEIQSLGHVQFMTLAHPEIAEIPENKKTEFVDERLADIPPNEFYAHSFCPSNEKSYEILFDLMEEIIATFEPKEFVHMGHDEVYQIGVCPICSKKDPADLYYEDVMKLYNFLKKKNLKMMIWSDMINSASAYKTVPAIDRLPKDIVLLDFIWYFHHSKDIENNLLEKGFNVIIGNLYSSYFPRFEKRIRTSGMLGGEVSAWTRTKECTMQREGKFYDIIYSSEMLWSESYLEDCRPHYDKIIRTLIPPLRKKIQGLKDYSFEKLFVGTSQTLELSVNKRAEALTFTHSSKYLFSKTPWSDGDILGSYTVTYIDGTFEEIPLKNGYNVYFEGTRQNAPIADGYFRHTGYVGTWATDEVRKDNKTYYKYLWLNPHPEKEIKNITLNSISPITVIEVEG